jgi:DNA-binding LacI/PurR family transcriptional regulator
MAKRRTSSRFFKEAGEAGRRFAALLLPDSEGVVTRQRYYGELLRGLCDGLLAGNVMLRPIQCLHQYQKDHFLSSPPDFYVGVVVLGELYTEKAFLQAVVEYLHGPKVMLDHHLEGVAMHSVREDAVSGMRMMTEHLLSLGHRHLVYVDLSSPEGNPWKREGVNLALRENGLPELGRGRVAGCRNNYSDVAAALEWFEGLDPRPTAVVCCDDSRALWTVQAAAERGLRVPGDISVSGFGDGAVSSGRSEFLTSMAVDVVRLGHRAAELVVGDPHASPVSVLVAPELKPRRSTAAPADRDQPAGPSPGGG